MQAAFFLPFLPFFAMTRLLDMPHSQPHQTPACVWESPVLTVTVVLRRVDLAVNPAPKRFQKPSPPNSAPAEAADRE